jgi:hypothetical protein
MADLEAEAATPASEVAETQETPQTEEVVETPVEETPIAAVTVEKDQPQVEEPLKDLFELKADGRVEQVTLDELKRRASAGTNYTRDKMQLAEERRQLNEWYQKTEADRQAQLRNKDFLAQQYNELIQAEQAQVAQQENAQRPVAQQLSPEQLLQLVDQRAQAIIFQNELTHWKNDTQQNINRHTTELVSKNELLKDIDGIDVLIRREAGKRVNADTAAGKVTSLDEVRTYLDDAAKAYVGKFEKRIKDHEQAAIMRHTKAQQPTIAPKGGGIPAVQTAPKFKWGSGDMAKSIEQELLATRQK